MSLADSNREVAMPPGESSMFPTLAVGTIVDNRYEILSVLGRGGGGCVYKVRQVIMQKIMALKTLNPSNSNISMLRLQKEAQALSRLEHRHIVQANDFGMIDGSQPFFAMEYVDGPTLAQYLKQVGSISVESMIELFAPLCQALSYAERKGVVHRDIKPSNIVLARDANNPGKFVAKIVDFGIAKIQHGDESAAALTKTGAVFGTPSYMSPEQCLGQPADHRSDIYSLGCVIFESLVGTPPYTASNQLEVIMKHISGEIPTLREASLGGKFPQAIEQIVANMLAKDPDERYQSCDDVFEDFQSLQEKRSVAPIVARESDAVNDNWKRKAIFVSSLLVSLIVVTGSVFVFTGLHKPVAKSLDADTVTTKQNIEDPKNSVMSVILDQGRTYEQKAHLNGQTYFSEVKGDKLCFTFPTAMIGKFKYWATPTDSTITPAQNSVTVARNAKLILFPAAPLLVEPALWSKFRQDDLYGIRMDLSEAVTRDEFEDKAEDILHKDGIRSELTDLVGKHKKSKAHDMTIISSTKAIFSKIEDEYDREPIAESNENSQNVKAALAFDKLHLLGLLSANFNDRTWLHMGTMPQLRWLWLDSCIMNGKTIKGDNFSQLANLNKMRVISIDKLEAPTELLKKLGKSEELKRLSLGGVTLTKEDLALIAKIPKLDTLRLRGKSKLTAGASLASLADAPNLERLAFSDQLKPDRLETLAELVKLKHLKELIVEWPEHSQEYAAIKVVPGCKVIAQDRATSSWFDFTKENPDLTDLW